MSKIIEGKEYLTVKEFAAAANISDKAVYQQVKSRLERFSVKVDNQIFLEKSALEIFYSSQLDTKNSQVFKESSSGIEAKYIDILARQLETKDKQIEELQEQLKAAEAAKTEMSKQIIELSSNIADMANKAQYITAASETNKLIDKKQEPIQEEQQVKKSFWDRLRGK